MSRALIEGQIAHNLLASRDEAAQASAAFLRDDLSGSAEHLEALADIANRTAAKCWEIVREDGECA